MTRAHGRSLRRGERGTAAVELGLLLPVLIGLLLISLEGGLFLAEHISVVNAAREGARFLVDGGSDAEMASLVLGSNRHLAASAAGMDAWVLRGQTNGSGVVTISSTTHPVGSSAGGPQLTADTIQSRLAGAGAGTAANLQFVAVEAAFRHASVTGRVVLPGGAITLRSYSLIRRI